MPALYTVNPGAGGNSADVNQFKNLLTGTGGQVVSLASETITAGGALTIKHAASGPSQDHRIVGGAAELTVSESAPEGYSSPAQGDVVVNRTRGVLSVCRATGGTVGTWEPQGSGTVQARGYTSPGVIYSPVGLNAIPLWYWDDPHGDSAPTQSAWTCPYNGWYRFSAAIAMGVGANSPQIAYAALLDGTAGTEIMRGEMVTLRLPNQSHDDKWCLRINGRVKLSAQEQYQLAIYNGGPEVITVWNSPTYSFVNFEYCGYQ